MVTTCPARERRFGSRPAAASESTLPAPPPRDVWLAYKREPTIRVRNLIIEAYLPLLRTIAASVYKRLPSQVELEELISAGLDGLMDAIEKYDPNRKVRFSTFCSRRVRGSIIDGLRLLDLPPRQVREHEAMVKRTCDAFQKQFGRPPCDQEVIDRLGVEPRQARKILRNGRVTHFTSLSEPASSGLDRPIRIEETIADSARPSAPSQAMLRDLRDWALRHLSRTERLVMILYYSEGMTMREIGRVLGLSESRVCQLRSVVLAKLQAQARARMQTEPD